MESLKKPTNPGYATEVRMRPASLVQSVLLIALAMGLVVSTMAHPGSPMTAGMVYGSPELKSVGTLAFGPEGILFAGDAQSAAVFAFDLNDETKDSGNEQINIEGIDKKLAAMMGTTADSIFIHDMAVNPLSHNIYLSVSRGRGADAAPVLMRITKKGAIEEVPLTNIRFSKATLANPPKLDAKTQWGELARPMAITHLGFVDGQLFVAGLSGEEFSSNLKRYDFPFKDKSESTAVEIFHTSHNRYETHAPIETFLSFHVNGKPSLLAGYGCSPLAVFPIADLKEKKSLRGTTVAELGGGNRPLDIISFKRDGKEFILISNSNRTMMRINSEDLDKATPITTAVSGIYESSGVKYVSIAMTGVLQLDNLNDEYVVVISRDTETGALNLRSVPKKYL